MTCRDGPLHVSNFLALLILACSANSVTGFVGNMTESVVLVGASIQLSINGQGLSVQDRVVVRDAGTGCPGPYASTDDKLRTLALASSVCSSTGFCQPSPAVGGAPNINRGAAAGWQKATFYPVQLRWRGTFRVCYCTAKEVVGTAVWGTSPCDLPQASFPLVQVVYTTAGLYSDGDGPIATCAVDGGGALLPGCQFTVTVPYQGLSSKDTAVLVSGDPSALCGEASAVSAMLSPVSGTSSSQTFSLPAGLLVLTQNASLDFKLKVCYCESQASTSLDGTCGAGALQLAGFVTFAGFQGPLMGGSAAKDTTCFRNEPCRVVRSWPFGLETGDTAVAVAGPVICSSLDSQVGRPVMATVSSSTVTVQFDGLNLNSTGITVCYCPSSVYGIHSCRQGDGFQFPLLLGWVRLVGLSQQLNISCLPSATSCPEQPISLSPLDSGFAQQGRAFVTPMTESPCTAAGASYQEVTLLPNVVMPWPLWSGQYAICFCDIQLGCPQPDDPVPPPMQLAGVLTVLGDVSSVSVIGEPGVASILLAVGLSRPSPGIKCCAWSSPPQPDEEAALVCTSLHATSILLSMGRAYALPLVLPGPLQVSNGTQQRGVKVTCRGLQGRGRCAAVSNTTWPCTAPLGGLPLSLPPVPEAWQRNWKGIVGQVLPLRGFLQQTGALNVIFWLKVVPRPFNETPTCSGSRADVVRGLPCLSDSCASSPDFLAVAAGSFSLCICEAAAVSQGTCSTWHRLGDLDIAGPLPLTSTLQATSGQSLNVHLDGTLLDQQDQLFALEGSSQSLQSCNISGPAGAGRISLATLSYCNSTSEDFELVVPDIDYVILCWHSGRGIGPAVPVGAVSISSRLSDCKVGDWEQQTECAATCGAGPQVFSRKVLVGSAGGGQLCPPLEQRRVCFGPSCNATVQAWQAVPPFPAVDVPIQLQVQGRALSDTLLAYLVPTTAQATDAIATEGGDADAAVRQGVCTPAAAAAAAAANCTGSSAFLSCNFSRGIPTAGGYQLCLCQTSSPGVCSGFLPPPKGVLSIGDCPDCSSSTGLSMAGIMGGTLAALFVVTASSVVLMGKNRRKMLWEKLKMYWQAGEEPESPLWKHVSNMEKGLEDTPPKGCPPEPLKENEAPVVEDLERQLTEVPAAERKTEEPRSPEPGVRTADSPSSASSATEESSGSDAAQPSESEATSQSDGSPTPLPVPEKSTARQEEDLPQEDQKEIGLPGQITDEEKSPETSPVAQAFGLGLPPPPPPPGLLSPEASPTGPGRSLPSMPARPPAPPSKPRASLPPLRVPEWLNHRVAEDSECMAGRKGSKDPPSEGTTVITGCEVEGSLDLTAANADGADAAAALEVSPETPRSAQEDEEMPSECSTPRASDSEPELEGGEEELPADSEQPPPTPEPPAVAESTAEPQQEEVAEPKEPTPAPEPPEPPAEPEQPSQAPEPPTEPEQPTPAPEPPAEPLPQEEEPILAPEPPAEPLPEELQPEEPFPAPERPAEETSPGPQLEPPAEPLPQEPESASEPQPAEPLSALEPPAEPQPEEVPEPQEPSGPPEEDVEEPRSPLAEEREPLPEEVMEPGPSSDIVDRPETEADVHVPGNEEAPASDAPLSQAEATGSRGEVVPALQEVEEMPRSAPDEAAEVCPWVPEAEAVLASEEATDLTPWPTLPEAPPAPAEEAKSPCSAPLPPAAEDESGEELSVEERSEPSLEEVEEEALRPEEELRSSEVEPPESAAPALLLVPRRGLVLPPLPAPVLPQPLPEAHGDARSAVLEPGEGEDVPLEDRVQDWALQGEEEGQVEVQVGLVDLVQGFDAPSDDEVEVEAAAPSALDEWETKQGFEAPGDDLVEAAAPSALDEWETQQGFEAPSDDVVEAAAPSALDEWETQDPAAPFDELQEAEALVNEPEGDTPSTRDGGSDAAPVPPTFSWNVEPPPPQAPWVGPQSMELWETLAEELSPSSEPQLGANLGHLFQQREIGADLAKQEDAIRVLEESLRAAPSSSHLRLPATAYSFDIPRPPSTEVFSVASERLDIPRPPSTEVFSVPSSVPSDLTTVSPRTPHADGHPRWTRPSTAGVRRLPQGRSLVEDAIGAALGQRNAIPASLRPKGQPPRPDSAKGKKGGSDASAPSLRGLALVDGGTLMLYQGRGTSEASSGSSGAHAGSAGARPMSASAKQAHGQAAAAASQARSDVAAVPPTAAFARPPPARPLTAQRRPATAMLRR